MFKRNLFIIAVLFLSTLSYSQSITEAEYFWDTDPGVGNGTTLLALDGNFDQAIEDLFLSLIHI